MPLGLAGSGTFVVVLDAGHGGDDPGTIGRIAKEKDINLGVVLRLGQLIESGQPDVKVVYTRKGDYFKTLQERCAIANEAKGELFISVHVNSLDRKAKNRTTIAGAATYTLGLHRTAENLAVAKRENAVMMLEDDYTERYCGFDPNSSESYIIFELNQNKHLDQSIDFAGRVQKELGTTAARIDKGVRQAGFWVLANTSMPAVLVELDFICNPNSEKFLASTAGQKKLARAIYNAFVDYKHSYDAATGGDHTVPAGDDADEDDGDGEVEKEQTDAADGAEATSASTAAAGRCYRVQFLTSPTRLDAKDKQLRGVADYVEYRDGKLWKYTTGDLPDMAAARRRLAKLRKQFPDAFIITIVDGKRVK